MWTTNRRDNSSIDLAAAFEAYVKLQLITGYSEFELTVVVGVGILRQEHALDMAVVA